MMLVIKLRFYEFKTKRTEKIPRILFPFITLTDIGTEYAAVVTATLPELKLWSVAVSCDPGNGLRTSWLKHFTA